MKHRNLLIVIATIAGAAILLSLYFTSNSQLDPSECRRSASEQNRWEFCPPPEFPDIKIILLEPNSADDTDSNPAAAKHEYSNQFATECGTTESCDMLTYSRVFRWQEPIITLPSERPDIIFSIEGQHQPHMMTLKIQRFLPVASDTDNNIRVENITDTGLTLAQREAFEKQSLTYSTRSLPEGYFILNVISKWEEDTLMQNREAVTLHRFLIRAL